MSKFCKGLAIAGGVFALSEFCGITGEAQALYAVSLHDNDVAEEVLEQLSDDDDLRRAGLTGYRKWKCKLIANFTRTLMKINN